MDEAAYLKLCQQLHLDAGQGRLADGIYPSRLLLRDPAVLAPAWRVQVALLDRRVLPVDELPGRDRRQPRARVARRVLGPHPQRLQQRLLQRVLGGIEVLAPPDQAREQPRDEGAQRALVQPSRRLVDHAGSSSEGASDMTSRTSIHSYSGSPPGPGSEET